MRAGGGGAGRADGGGPLVWALLGHRAGDNLQVEALAEALERSFGWPVERKSLAWRRRAGWTPLYGRMGPSLAPLTAQARARIGPPWPDLVISVGWRSVPVARWIGARSGARLVHIGRPRARLAAFDLILTTPQYVLPKAPNILRLPGPLTRLSPERLAEAAEAWRARLARLPRPWIALLVGGDAPPLRLTPAAAAELGEKADALARGHGGSLLVATGPRTPAEAAEAVLARIRVPCHRFLWGEGGDNTGDNPYPAYIALADAFVVTADSISMMHEAALTGRPLHLFELPRRGSWKLRALQRLDWRLRDAPGAPGRLYRHLIREGWRYAPRDPEAFRAPLIESGRAVPLGDPHPALGSGQTKPEPERVRDPIRRAVAAVRALFPDAT